MFELIQTTLRLPMVAINKVLALGRIHSATTLSITTFSISTLSITGLFATLSINVTLNKRH